MLAGHTFDTDDVRGQLLSMNLSFLAGARGATAKAEASRLLTNLDDEKWGNLRSDRAVQEASLGKLAVSYGDIRRRLCEYFEQDRFRAFRLVKPVPELERPLWDELHGLRDADCKNCLDHVFVEPFLEGDLSEAVDDLTDHTLAISV